MGLENNRCNGEISVRKWHRTYRQAGRAEFAEARTWFGYSGSFGAAAAIAVGRRATDFPAPFATECAHARYASRAICRDAYVRDEHGGCGYRSGWKFGSQISAAIIRNHQNRRLRAASENKKRPGNFSGLFSSIPHSSALQTKEPRRPPSLRCTVRGLRDPFRGPSRTVYSRRTGAPHRKCYSN